VGSAEGIESITLTSADGGTTAVFVPEANLVCRAAFRIALSRGA
jgi:hypothetical protein